jgi:hypothetical protein
MNRINECMQQSSKSDVKPGMLSIGHDVLTAVSKAKPHNYAHENQRARSSIHAKSRNGHEQHAYNVAGRSMNSPAVNATQGETAPALNNNTFKQLRIIFARPIAKSDARILIPA